MSNNNVMMLSDLIRSCQLLLEVEGDVPCVYATPKYMELQPVKYVSVVEVEMEGEDHDEKCLVFSDVDFGELEFEVDDE